MTKRPESLSCLPGVDKFSPNTQIVNTYCLTLRHHVAKREYCKETTSTFLGFAFSMSILWQNILFSPNLICYEEAYRDVWYKKLCKLVVCNREF